MQRWSNQFFTVIQPRFINPGCRHSDIGDGVVDGIEGSGDWRVVGPWQIGQSDLGPLKGQAGLLEGFVGRAEAFGPRVKGVHLAFGVSSCGHLQDGEHLSLQPQSLHWAWAGVTARISKAMRMLNFFITSHTIAESR
jgi:hypothetical protein